MKFLIVGGQPKGFPVPFHPDTLSGKRIHAVIERSKHDIKLFDLWENAEQERKGKLDPKRREMLVQFMNAGYTFLAAGGYVYGRLLENGFGAISMLHPAARTIDPMAEWRRVLGVSEL